jgi:hypothetical protein
MPVPGISKVFDFDFRGKPDMPRAAIRATVVDNAADARRWARVRTDDKARDNPA